MNRKLSLRLVVAAAVVALAALLAGPAAGATISRGATGPAVAALNAKLASLTYLAARTASDRFTTGTHHAVVAFQKVRGLTPDGVVGPLTTAALRSAAPPRPRLARPGKRIEVLRSKQVAFLVADGRVKRTINVSTGKAGYTTPAGSFRVFRRETRSWSYSYSVWLPWAAYFNGGIAFHGHRDVPPYAASHGCVRIPMPFSREVYGFARLGRRVHVL